MLRALLLLANVFGVLLWGATASSSAVVPDRPPAAHCAGVDAPCRDEARPGRPVPQVRWK